MMKVAHSVTAQESLREAPIFFCLASFVSLTATAVSRDSCERSGGALENLHGERLTIER